MSDADVRFMIKFSEHIPTADWETRREKIACFCADCWYQESKDDSWEEICSLDADEIKQWLEEWGQQDGSYTCFRQDGRDYFDMELYEFYGNIYNTADETRIGMQEFFPDVDFEFVCYVCDNGSAEEDVTIVEGGKQYDGNIVFRYIGEYTDDVHDKALIDEILRRDEFITPDATVENPYPMPKAILLSKGEYAEPVTGFWK